MCNRSTPRKDGRIEYIDALRTVACFAVVLLHVNAVNTYHVEFQSHEWQVFMFYESIVNWAVPMFAMISGATLLNRECDYRRMLRKCGALAELFIVWSVIYLLSDLANNGVDTYGGALWLQVLLQGHYHMWYLIMLFGLYLVAPLIKPIASKTQTARAFVCLSAVFTFLIPSVLDMSLLRGTSDILLQPIVGAVYRALRNNYDDLYFHLTLGFAAYLVAGYCIVHCVSLTPGRRLVSGALLAATGTLFTFLEIRFAASKEAAGVFMRYYQPGIAMQAGGILLAGKALSKGKLTQLLARLAPLTLGIYMIHPLLIEALQKVGVTSLLFDPRLSVPLLALGVFALSGALVCLLRATPLSRLMRLERRRH